MTPEGPPTLGNPKEHNERKTISSSLNNKGIRTDKELTKGPKKDLPIPIPFQVCQGSYEKKICYYVISHLKQIPVRLSVKGAQKGTYSNVNAP